MNPQPGFPTSEIRVPKLPQQQQQLSIVGTVVLIQFSNLCGIKSKTQLAQRSQSRDGKQNETHWLISEQPVSLTDRTSKAREEAKAGADLRSA